MRNRVTIDFYDYFYKFKKPDLINQYFIDFKRLCNNEKLEENKRNNIYQNFKKTFEHIDIVITAFFELISGNDIPDKIKEEINKLEIGISEEREERSNGEYEKKLKDAKRAFWTKEN